jgi:hypothetical protein
VELGASAGGRVRTARAIAAPRTAVVCAITAPAVGATTQPTMSKVGAVRVISTLEILETPLTAVRTAAPAILIVLRHREGKHRAGYDVSGRQYKKAVVESDYPAHSKVRQKLKCP